jgi:hypothetical protein
MELTRITVTDGADGSRARLGGEVRYDDTGASEWYWFDVPATCASALSRDGTPWLAALLPLAVTLKQPLRIALPVDPHLLRQAREIMQVWRSWYPALSVVPVEAESRPQSGSTPARDHCSVRRAGAFFSGGVDSFFTALRPRPDMEPPIDELVSVWGFDVPLEHADAIARLRHRFAGVARDLGLGFTDVATNLRSTRWRESDWATLAHGCALGAVALALESRYANVMIAATGGYRDLHPWGSHPLTDPMFSTTETGIVHDGAAFTRTEKTRLLATSPVAMRELRVCWRSGTDVNCESCSKCYRTMLILELLGALPECATFSSDAVDLRAAERVLCAQPWDYREFRDIHALALAVGRTDIARAVERTVSRSRALGRHLETLRAWGARGIVGPLARRVERELLAGWIQ